MTTGYAIDGGDDCLASQLRGHPEDHDREGAEIPVAGTSKRDALSAPSAGFELGEALQRSIQIPLLLLNCKSRSQCNTCVRWMAAEPHSLITNVSFGGAYLKPASFAVPPLVIAG